MPKIIKKITISDSDSSDLHLATIRYDDLSNYTHHVMEVHFLNSARQGIANIHQLANLTVGQLNNFFTTDKSVMFLTHKIVESYLDEHNFTGHTISYIGGELSISEDHGTTSVRDFPVCHAITGSMIPPGSVVHYTSNNEVPDDQFEGLKDYMLREVIVVINDNVSVLGDPQSLEALMEVS
ncbi:MAG UNVERIFIED_CONTAM: hypothetical protein LVQ98_04195 [Rickettsiaceae bacterium]|jgi:hypothetical protein